MPDSQVHVVFFPFLAPGHMVSLVDIARLFAEHGALVSIVTTPANAHRIQPTIDASSSSGHHLNLHLIPFPSAEVGLPAGCENSASLPSPSDIGKFFQAIDLLQHALERLLRDLSPDCLVSDTIYTWSSDLAIKLGIPRVVFFPSSHFVLSLSDKIELHSVLDAVSGDHDSFVIPGIPHHIELTRAVLPTNFMYPFVVKLFREANDKSFGTVMNSFDELAPEYVEQCRLGGTRKVWCVGPVSLCNRTDANANVRGGADGAHWIKEWLDTKEPSSVLYACFGSECVFSNDQLREIAVGLEESGRPFIWVIRGGSGGADALKEWLPQGYEEKIKSRGLLITTWAPQVMILNHPAVGGFLMHCGWNSVLETVCAGVPVIGWPIQSDNFMIERLVMDVMGIGVRVLEGMKRTNTVEERELVKGEAIKKLVERVVGDGEEAAALRKKAEEFQAKALAAMKEGGSSYNNTSNLIEELARERRKKKEVGNKSG